VQLAPILNIDLDPTRQRLVLDAGSRDGVQVGQTVIDAGGLLGQIIAVEAGSATVLLITDPDHAVPVVVARTGVRLVVYGKGRSDRLELANIPLSSDIRRGDVIVTSGLGGRFPAGFPVGTVESLAPDLSHAFLVGRLKPAAQLDRGRDVLLLRQGAALPAPAASVAASAATATPPSATKSPEAKSPEAKSPATPPPATPSQKMTRPVDPAANGPPAPGAQAASHSPATAPAPAPQRPPTP
jgi:rod shape-determining protein MreC